MIGNVPFADVKLDYRGQRLSLHDFFFAKSLDALKPGGVLALVTTHFTLDKQNAAVREYLADRADFLGAIRLPSDAFKREGTAVVTDIVFLRKRGRRRAGTATSTPTGSRSRRSPSRASRSRSIATSSTTPRWCWAPGAARTRLYGGEGYSVIGNGDLAEQLQAAIGRLPESSPRSQPSPAEEHGPAPSRRRRLNATSPKAASSSATTAPSARSIGGQAVPVIYGGTLLKADGTMTGKRLAALIGLRDHARRVLQSQNEGWPEAAPRRRPPRA